MQSGVYEFGMGLNNFIKKFDLRKGIKNEKAYLNITFIIIPD